MKEAKITCSIAEWKLQDVPGMASFTLQNLDEVWLTVKQYQESKDVAAGLRIGALSVVWKERMQQLRPPAPPHFRRIVPGHNLSPGSVPPSTPPSADMAAEVKAAVEAQLGSFKEELFGKLGQLMAEQAQPAAPAESSTGVAELQKMMEKLLATAAQGGGTVSTSVTAAPKQDAATPMFVPKNIVGKTSGNIEVQKGETSSDGVDAAAEALRALRKQRKKDGNK